MANIGKYIEQLREISKALANTTEIAKRVNIVAGKAIEAEYRKRIFVQGKDSSLRKIGKYNTTKPLYINPTKAKGLPKAGLKPTKGKTGKSRFNNGNLHKTKYFASYKDFRAAVGRQTSFVDLNLTGATFESVATGVKGNKVVLGFRNLKSIEKMRGNEKRFGRKILNISNQERKVWRKAVQLEISAIIKEILK